MSASLVGSGFLFMGDAAGMHTDCPTCGSSVTVPQTSGLNDRHYAGTKRSRDKRRPMGAVRDAIALRESGEDLDMTEVTALRHDLAEASVETTRLERELGDAREQLAVARADAAKFRQQHEVASAEMEKGQANARHTQAELKSFQNERLTLKNELAVFRQKLGAAEERLDFTHLELLEAQARLGEQETELDGTRRAMEALHSEAGRLRVERTQLQDEAVRLSGELEASDRAVASFNSALRNLGMEFEAAKELLNEAQADRTTALREIQALNGDRTKMLRQIEEDRAQLALLAQTEAKLSDRDRDLAQTRSQLAATEDSARKTNDEIAELRRTVSEKSVGREFIEARAQLEAMQIQHAKALEEGRKLRISLDKQESAARTADESLKAMRQQVAEALRAAEAGSESRLRRDNDVLRGIVARQNGDLEQKHIQLVRLKQARLALKIIYSIFALGLIAIGVCAVKFVPALRF